MNHTKLVNPLEVGNPAFLQHVRVLIKISCTILCVAVLKRAFVWSSYTTLWAHLVTILEVVCSAAALGLSLFIHGLHIHGWIRDIDHQTNIFYCTVLIIISLLGLCFDSFARLSRSAVP